MRLAIGSFVICLAGLIPSIRAESEQTLLKPTTDPAHEPYKIAIIGAGAAGSSAAYHLAQFARSSQHELPINITIYEADGRIGGRTTTINALDDPRYPVELGASIFVDINQILYNATRDFSLLADDKIYESTGVDYDLGVWDGTSFLFTTTNDDDRSGLKGTLSGWWGIAKVLWKYGLSPIRLRSLQQGTIGQFLRMYDEVFPFQDLTEAAKAVGLISVTGQTGPELLAAAGVGEKFSREVIQASSRVNYAQNLDHFHGLETVVCMSTEGAMSIEGGNWQIFDRMVKQSGASVRLNTTILDVRTTHTRLDSSSVLYVDETGRHRSSGFDRVILAAPYTSSKVHLHPKPAQPPSAPDYVTLHVTLFATPFRPSPQFFGYESNQAHLIPDTVLTTLPQNYKPTGRGTKAVGPTTFWSLSTLRILHPTTDNSIPSNIQSGHIPDKNLSPLTYTDPTWPGLDASGALYLYKIFSPAPLSAPFLIDLFGWCNHPSLPPALMRSTCAHQSTNADTPSEPVHNISTLSTELLNWHHEKIWESYPYETPITNFSCFDVYGCGEDGQENELRGKLWHTSPIEQFISTMETSALAGRNIARLIVDDFEKELERRVMAGLMAEADGGI